MSVATHNYKKSTIISVGSDKPKSAENKHYVKNKDFYAALVERRDLWNEMKDADPEINPPKITDFIGKCVLQIATNLSRKSNFVNYRFREEMISDAVLCCIQNIDCFDPEKSKNPFSYFTQVCYYAFIGRISGEKKHTYIKFKSMINSTMVSEAADNEGDLTIEDVTSNMSEFNTEYIDEFVDTYEQKNSLGVYKKPKKSRKKNALENIIEEEKST